MTQQLGRPIQLDERWCHLLSWERRKHLGFGGGFFSGAGGGLHCIKSSIWDMLPLSVRYSRGEIKQAGVHASRAQNRFSVMERSHWQASIGNGTQLLSVSPPTCWNMTYITTWIYLKIIILSERCHTKRGAYLMIPFISNSRKWKWIYSNRKQIIFIECFPYARPCYTLWETQRNIRSGLKMYKIILRRYVKAQVTTIPSMCDKCHMCDTSNGNSYNHSLSYQ